ncbi:MAG TPA: hypothetical protein H9766_05730 [Candidatus Dorea faecigallinarum]|nr:hypothetical protein [Candidatus Dorea faecigallinarum]
MLDLTFGEQVKLILSRRGMTIKELAETIEIRTGKKMSRQNLTQRLGRDNFQEQDMRMIAEILDCPFQLSILGEDGATTEKIQNRPAEPVYEKEPEAAAEEAAAEPEYTIEEPETAEPEYTEEPEYAEEPEETQERDITIGELVDIHEELDARIQEQEEKKSRQKEEKKHGWRSYLMRKIHRPEEAAGNGENETISEAPETKKPEELSEEEELKIRTPEAIAEQVAEAYAAEEEPVYYEEATEEQPEETAAEEEPEDPYAEFRMSDEEDLEKGDINPYTGREYKSNSVRMHPTRIGYVQVYDRGKHTWTDMTEWAFLGYQERKKALMGKDYDPPIYLD